MYIRLGDPRWPTDSRLAGVFLCPAMAQICGSRAFWYDGDVGLPKRLKILNLTYDLRWVDKQIESATDSHGFCDTSEQLIVVNAEQKPDALADTVLHELNHALFSAFAISGELTEERVVRLMATGLCTVLRDNPDFTKWWIKNL